MSGRSLTEMKLFELPGSRVQSPPVPFRFSLLYQVRCHVVLSEIRVPLLAVPTLDFVSSIETLISGIGDVNAAARNGKRNPSVSPRCEKF